MTYNVEQWFRMKERVLLLLLVLAAAALAFSPLCSAVASLSVYGYTDQAFYRPGDTGTLKFWIYNDGTEDLILKNLTIYYPWYNPAGLWGGNETIIPSTSTVIPAGGNWNSTSSFTVPNDGRAPSGSNSIRITVNTDKVTRSSTISMSVTSVPFYFSLQNMGDLTTWLAALVVLMVICTLIIAAIILLSVRRRQTT
jgi:uncharacterized membrane protein